MVLVAVEEEAVVEGQAPPQAPHGDIASTAVVGVAAGAVVTDRDLIGDLGAQKKKKKKKKQQHKARFLLLAQTKRHHHHHHHSQLLLLHPLLLLLLLLFQPLAKVSLPLCMSVTWARKEEERGC